MSIPVGFTEVVYQGRPYSLSRTDFNGGKSIKVYAKDLSGTDFISFNYYQLSESDSLKPCEMPAQKVIDFLTHYQLKT